MTEEVATKPKRGAMVAVMPNGERHRIRFEYRKRWRERRCQIIQGLLLDIGSIVDGEGYDSGWIQAARTYLRAYPMETTCTCVIEMTLDLDLPAKERKWIVLYAGKAVCSPSDVFLKRTARQLALSRAYADAPKEHRTVYQFAYDARNYSQGIEIEK